MSALDGQRIAVFLGGCSGEREVSLRSGASIAAALRRLGAQVQEVDPSSDAWSLAPDTALAFLALHGEGGEDGTIQEALESMRMPYTGSGVDSSRLAFDKAASKTVFEEVGLPTLPSVRLWDLGDRSNPNIEFPLVIKPICGGSSLHLHFVDSKEEWDTLVPSLPRSIDFLVERKVSGREFTVGVLAERALPIVEILPKDGRYDYANKYTPGGASYQCPASLPAEGAEKMATHGLEAFRALGCRDYGRVDVMMEACGSQWLLEVNTLPGMTETSLLPKAAAAAGLEFDQLCEAMALAAWRRSENTP